MTRVAFLSAPLVRALRPFASRPGFAQARSFAVGIGAGDPSTPGWVPAVGNKIAPSVALQKARKWDEGVADGFKASSYDEVFKVKKVNFLMICHASGKEANHEFQFIKYGYFKTVQAISSKAKCWAVL